LRDTYNVRLSKEVGFMSEKMRDVRTPSKPVHNSVGGLVLEVKFQGTRRLRKGERRTKR
jgi:hypothetical protein